MTRLEVTEEALVEAGLKLSDAQKRIVQLEARVLSECNRLNSIIRKRDLRIAQLEQEKFDLELGKS